MTLFGFNVEKALPYLLGGAFLFWVYKRFFGSQVVAKIEKETVKARVEYITMTESEREQYAKTQSDLILDLLKWRFGSSWRDCSDVVAIVKGNSFCIVKVGEMFEEHWVFSPLSRYLTHSLGADDMVQIADEIATLRENGY